MCLTMLRKTAAILDHIHNALADGTPPKAADISSLRVVRSRPDYFGFTGSDLNFYLAQYDNTHDTAERRVELLERHINQLIHDHTRAVRDLLDCRKDDRARLINVRDCIARDRARAHTALNAARIDIRVSSDMVDIITKAQAARGGWGAMELELAPAQTVTVER